MKPLALESVSVTELYSFRECHRSWYLGYVRKLDTKIEPFRYWFGTGLHAALQAYHMPGGTLEDALKAYDTWYKVAEKSAAEGYGMLWEGAKQEYFNAYDLTRKMLHNYDSFHRAQAEVWEPIAVEQRVWVPILHPKTRRALPGKPRLTARFDFLGYRGQRRSDTLAKRGVVIVDHKSASQQPAATGRDLDLDDQLTGYAYVYWRLTGELPDEIVYNTLIKRAPGPPELIRGGTQPSKAKDQPTTYGMYMETLNELGLDPRNYLDVLDNLKRAGWDRYFVREGVTKNLYQLEAYERHLYDTYQDMVRVVKDPETAYPSPSSMRCGGCIYASVSQAMDDGSDYESLIEARLRVNPEERW